MPLAEAAADHKEIRQVWGEEVKVKDEKLREFYDQETRKVVEILKNADPEKIIRFGSSVWGTLSEDSDIDFCILKHLEDGSVREKQRLRRLLSRYEYAYPVDIELHVYSPEEYEERLRRGKEAPSLEKSRRGRWYMLPESAGLKSHARQAKTVADGKTVAGQPRRGMKCHGYEAATP